MLTRRGLIRTAGAGVALASSGAGLKSVVAAGLDMPAALPEGIRNSAVLDALPGKKPLIKLSYRPPNYETPIEYFRTAITPNDAFFVRYHLSDIPEVDAKTWKLAVGGDGANGQAELTPRRSQAAAGRSRWSRSTNARATAAACSSRTCPASNGATAPWAAPAGRARGSRTCSTRSASRRRRSRSRSTAPTGRQRQDAGLHQEHPGLEGDRGHHARRLRDERRSRCRISTAFRRASSCRAGPAPIG